MTNHIEISIADWCRSAIDVLKRWEMWLIDFQLASGTASSEHIEAIVRRGEEHAKRLRQIFIERRSLLDEHAADSFRELYSRFRLSESLNQLIKDVELFAGKLRRNGLMQWINARQTFGFIDELVSIFRSGHACSATYSTDEVDANQGGFILDSTA
jgi:hypothetical protein